MSESRDTPESSDRPTSVTSRQPDWTKVERMVGAPDYGLAFCVSPWPDGGWMAGVQITDREWVIQQADPEVDQIDPAMLTVPGDADQMGSKYPDWDMFDGYKEGLNAHSSDAADAIERLWAMVHGEADPPWR